MSRPKQASGSIREDCIDCGSQCDDPDAFRCWACTLKNLQASRDARQLKALGESAAQEAAAKIVPAEPAAIPEPVGIPGMDEGQLRKAMDREIPRSTSPHQSVQMRCTEVRRAYRKGWIACLNSLKENGK